jgi:hypothetical protein
MIFSRTGNRRESQPRLIAVLHSDDLTASANLHFFMNHVPPSRITRYFSNTKRPQKDAERSRLPGSILRLEEYPVKFKKGRLILPA